MTKLAVLASSAVLPVAMTKPATYAAAA